MKSFSLTLNIRTKILLGYIVCLLIMSAIGLVSLYYLLLVGEKIRLLETADDFTNAVLEARRYEKNYLLYGSREDYEESRSWLARGFSMLDNQEPLRFTRQSPDMLSPLRDDLVRYGQIMEAIRVQRTARAEDDLRDVGKDLVDKALRASNVQRVEILRITDKLKVSLWVGLSAVALFGSILLVFVNRKFIRPLSLIEHATERIAQGRFVPLPLPPGRDEIRQVMAALNHMATELLKRQGQLVQAQKLSSIGTLSSGIAHQLNNPLNNISTSSQILKEELGGEAPEFQRRMLANIEQETFRARDIVRGLLEFSRHKDFNPASNRVKDMVERSILLIKSQAPAGVTLETDIPEDLVAFCDKNGMQEVLINLLLNAVQAIEQPPGTVRVTATGVPGRDEVRIAVSDTGKGMSEAVKSQVFDPFFSTKEVEVGTGLGLFIVYGLVLKNRGSISVESSVGQGATFFITLPKSPPPERAEVAR